MFNGHRVSVLEMDVGGGCTTMETYIMPQNCGPNGKFYVMYILQQ